MEWIRKNKLRLSVLSAIAAAAALGVLIVARGETSIALEPWPLGLAILPWAIFIVAFMPLVYLSWFGRARTKIFTIVGQLFFWLLASGMLVIFVMIYGKLVFGAW